MAMLNNMNFIDQLSHSLQGEIYAMHNMCNIHSMISLLQLTFPNMTKDNSALLCLGTNLSGAHCGIMAGCVADGMSSPHGSSHNNSYSMCSTMTVRRLSVRNEVWVDSGTVDTNLVDRPWLSFWEITKIR